MMNPEISNLLPGAIIAIETYLTNKENGKISKEYKGYIASFGPSVIQSGLLPTVAFYSEQGNANADRSKLLSAIAHILRWDLSSWNHQEPDKKRFLKYLNENYSDGIEDDVLDGIVALKLAFRTFDFENAESPQS